MNVAIIGGGAAGLMTAATILEKNSEINIFLIEKNNGLGKKVMISGGGRCNVTTGIRDVRTVLTNYPRGSKFLSSAMHQFSPRDIYEWFESHGVPLKTERDARVFPQSDNGKDIVAVFEQLFRHPNIHVLLNTSVTQIKKDKKGFQIFFKENETPLQVEKVVLTTGGQAYRHTGSTGDGYTFAASLGHSITKLTPSLNAFFTKETWPAQISGLSFSKATITATCSKPISFTGPFLFTHKGLSGPAIFALSSLITFEWDDSKQPLNISIDLFPDISEDALRHKIETVIASNPKRNWLNTMATIIPKSLALIVCEKLSLSPEKHTGDVPKKDLIRSLSWIKSIPLHVKGRDAGDEFVTAGGVELTEVNPSTMESNICPGLFFAGEILNIDGFTGGFNLQASWATGHLAGENIG
ncbi:MAG: NAD(FAD)-utilizing dehydrogenase [Candidatus Uhrbacteria bacterium GW2011_GWF2_41_16]|uniref:NAD(FAD)-utilizing dehydrogenase n=2 Tax=Candidatus Uhriibacteriota TaxID=1752732 RepID=A0A0G0VCM6_9BACT|nr:MAG: NAD(FAD)-utilizing dehydrogenase [Candidatus Uhrbacteria bacterium GW2011_GWA2_41_10]KKR87630.1 MAG: NAD(FAD)-utilizing dehydrogenase [Candidatus Uhrbacteria bacterium GW2011_GWC2_41_11]KKR98609.1 MAG: NAD(FAD)-utilizing dehydrogenase [Candidatus Uhrbacteria bacterium GW2011_GWF2_41_16]HBP00480.1 hypothetical protein [Candidatus Uhrbacteria bacterium]